MAKTKKSGFKSKNYVVESNDLVLRAYNDMKITEMKIFDVLVSCIDTSNPKKEVFITKSELMDAIGLSKGNYTFLKDSLKALRAKNFYIYNEEHNSTIITGLINEVEWFHDRDIVKVVFGERIMKYLIVHSDFFMSNLAYIKKINSKSSMMLYKALLSKFKITKRNVIEIDVDDIRLLLNFQDSYERFHNLKVRVLDPAVSDINKADLLFKISYEEIKNGREIISIKFNLIFPDNIEKTLEDEKKLLEKIAADRKKIEDEESDFFRNRNADDNVSCDYDQETGEILESAADIEIEEGDLPFFY